MDPNSNVSNLYNGARNVMSSGMWHCSLIVMC
jgi:hypothetical protein